jgi:dephospho-CoA kinase
LEAIIHPLVAAETARQASAAENQGARCIVFDVPLLVESGRWRPQLHQVLVVDCTEERQISRVMARSGWTREAVQKVIAAQASRAQRLAAADMCIYNETQSLGELAALARAAAARFGL